MTAKTLSIRNIQATVFNITRHIQVEKVDISRTKIRQLQSAGRWPDRYVSYSGTVGRNSFNDPDVFFGVMANQPKKYRQRFTFLPADKAAGLQLLEAASMAYDLVILQAYRYGIKTGLFRGSFVMFIREGSARRPMSSVSELENQSEKTVFEILSPLAYASTAEVNALYFAELGGIMYYAAQKVAAAFPDLGVRYVYHKAQEFNLPHIYEVPVLSIGQRTAVQDRLVKPGKNHRRRERIKRSKK